MFHYWPPGNHITNKICGGKMMEINILLAPMMMMLILWFGLPEIVHKPMEYFHVASLFIVLGGSFFALILGSKFSNLMAFLKCLSFIAFPPKTMAAKDYIKIITDLARITKTKGKAALVSEAEKIKDPFLRYGIQLVVDKAGEEFIRAALYNNIEEMSERHMTIITLYKNSAVAAPICGMVGTIVGLIQVLKNMADPSNLGAAMALGLIATFYGGFFSGMVFGPIAQKLKILNDDEAALKRMLTEGILFIEKEEIPLKVEKYLMSYLSFNSVGAKKGK